MPKFLIELDDRDWEDLCIIMRQLTWGKGDTMDRWHNLRKRIEEKKLFRVKADEPEPGN